MTGPMTWHARARRVKGCFHCQVNRCVTARSATFLQFYKHFVYQLAENLFKSSLLKRRGVMKAHPSQAHS